MADRLERAESIVASATRLVSLLKLNAPAIVIENERWILATRVLAFPAEAEQIAMREEVRDSLYRDEQEHLVKTGFYKDIDEIAGGSHG